MRLVDVRISGPLKQWSEETDRVIEKKNVCNSDTASFFLVTEDTEYVTVLILLPRVLEFRLALSVGTTVISAPWSNDEGINYTTANSQVELAEK